MSDQPGEDAAHRPAEVHAPNPELDAFSASLQRRQRALIIFLRVRAVFGLGLLAMAGVGGIMALAFLGAGVGVLDAPSLTRWTKGFDAVLSVFLPSAFTFLCAKTGLVWWQGRPRDASQDADVPSGGF